MNKLNEYKIKKAHETKAAWSIAEKTRSFGLGFDAALSLDLPVKFAEWQQGERRQLGDFGGAFDDMTWKELYQYWIDNIYKPE